MKSPCYEIGNPSVIYQCPTDQDFTEFMPAAVQSHGHICLRDTATVVQSPFPAQYEFFKAPFPQRKYRINFRHPAYAHNENILFSLYAWDHADGGIHYGLAHNACSIIADNRTDGYLSRTCDGEIGERIESTWDDVLSSAVTDYYFYVPYPSELSVPPNSQARTPYRWPVVATFQDWEFPKDLPEIWARCARFQRPGLNTTPQSNFTSAIRQRDVTCQITAFESGTEVAHLIPEHERRWFISNSMNQWNSDQTLDPDNLLGDLGNAVLLRSDLHKTFDERKFVFFPKHPDYFVLHMLQTTSDLGQLYHNTRVSIPECSLEFLFTRFAWSIFPLLSGFLVTASRSRLVIRLKEDKGERVTEEITNMSMLGKKATASRSNSPTKRSRIAAGWDNDDVEHVSKYQRICEATSAGSTFDSTPTTQDDYEVVRLKQPLQYVQTPKCARSMRYSDNRETTNLHVESRYIDELRQEALARQRPEGYNPKRPPYDKHRPAREELELMGVEIISNLDDDDSSGGVF